MSTSGFVSILPLVLLVLTSVLLILGIAIRRSPTFTYYTALVGTALSILSLTATPGIPAIVANMLLVDNVSVFFAGIILAALAAILMLSRGFRSFGKTPVEEYYVLIVLAACGAITLSWSAHFMSLFLGLELLSVSLYGLIAYVRERETSLEAGIKYLALASVSSSFLLFGLALLYCGTGSLDIEGATSTLAAIAELPSLIVTGLALVITGFAFKLALAPFHMWAPDVFEGSPAPVSAFIATVSKGSVFAILLRFFSSFNLQDRPPVFAIFTFLAIVSMFTGNLLALYQKNVKRLLACSSIANMGYILVAFLAAGPLRFQAVAFYLVIYFIMTLGAFGVVTVLSEGGREADSFEDFRGLAETRPMIAGLFTLMLLALSGMPVTAGFFAKFFIVAAGAGSSLWPLVLTVIVNSGIGLFYYLRLISTIYAGAPQKAPDHAMGIEGRIVLGVLIILLIWWGIYPSPLVEWIARFNPAF